MQYIKVATDQDNSLQFEHCDIPVIAADECLVKVAAIGVNRADLLQRAGKYPAPQGESEILGLEVCGEIVACGKDVESSTSTGSHTNNQQWYVGDFVFGLVAGGGYAQYVKVKATQLFKLPASLSVEQGAACAEVFLTAYQSLFTIANLQPNSQVLIHAGASGIGTAAIQLAKTKQCRVVVTVGSDEKAKACLVLGADEVINYHDTDFVAWSKTNVATGFDVIIDVVGGDYLSRNINVAALDGHIVILSMLGGRFCEAVDMAKLLAKRITMSASTLRNRSDSYKAKLVSDFTTDFYQDLSSGKISPVIDSVYSWVEVEAAHEKMAANKNIGKLILTIA